MNKDFQYVNWLNEEEKTPLKTSNSIIWKDIITGTTYYLDRNKALEISAKGIDYINSMGSTNEIYEYMAGKKVVEDEELLAFPQLPYIKEDREVPAYRISDHVIIRTGILYSIFGENDSIRRFGLTENINIFCNKDIVSGEIDSDVKEVIELIDKVLIGEEVDKGKSKKIKFDLVKGGTVKVQQYLLENNKIKDIRGASRILDDINRKIIPEYIKRNYIEECIVYVGGGNILGIFPEGEGEKISKIIEEIHEIESITAQSCASFRTCTLYDLSSNNYKNTMSDLELKITDRQMSKFDSRRNIKLRDEKIKGYKNLDGEDICEHCNIRHAFYESYSEGKL